MNRRRNGGKERSAYSKQTYARSVSAKVTPSILLLTILRDIVFAAIITYVFFGVLLNIVVVKGNSMNPTLKDGQLMVVQKLGYVPQFADIVVCVSVGNKIEEKCNNQIVKRVIGVEGDTIEIDYTAGIVYRNGEPLDEAYVNSPTNADLGQQFPLYVPEGFIFVLGDNRNSSFDSRSPDIGLVPKDQIVGGKSYK